MIELMIVVVIIAVLAAVGYPAYQSQVESAHLSEGRVALTQVAGKLERCYSRYGAYDDPDCDIRNKSENDTYKITLTTPGDGTFVATAERVKATDLNQCGDLTITQTGQKGVTGGASKSADECW
jgi:type IV pilus assembly protein PilE